MARKLPPNIERDTGYSGRMKRKVAKIPEHPKNLGIQMQAHHLISCTGMKASNLGKLIKDAGYNINDFPNLVYLPSTLQGACHLGVQLHRGDHSTSVDDDDNDHPKSYHAMVAKRIKGLKSLLDKACVGESQQRHESIVNALNKVSRRILFLIQENPKLAPLTRLYDHFQEGVLKGCTNLDNIPKKLNGLTDCSVDRNHHLNQNTNQSSENITYKGKPPYQLQVGQ